MKDLFMRIRNHMGIADFALMKTCLLSLGVLAGLFIPKKQKKKAVTCSSVVFSLSYAVLMARIISILCCNPGKHIDQEGRIRPDWWTHF